MKKSLFLLFVFIGTVLYADYLEVKTGEGKAGVAFDARPKLYVCYTKRVKLVTDDAIYLRYDGCARYTYSCKSNGKARFGKYPNENAARRALRRCQTAEPRFID